MPEPTTPPHRMVPLTVAADPFEARLLAARLGAEGMVWELRGNHDGPYPVGQITVLVSADDLDDAPALLHSDEVEGALAGEAAAASARPAWVAVAVLALVALFALVRILAYASDGG